MAQQEWKLDPARGVCASTGRPLGEGEEFYTVLFEDGDSFRRADYCVSAWEGPPAGSFCHFRTRIAVKEKRKKLLVDNPMLVAFFLRLADEVEPIRVQFRFVVALILLRKRLLRYETTVVEGGVETWSMTLMTDRSTHAVVNPRLTDDQIEGVSQQLSQILHSDMGTWTDDSASSGSPDPDGEVTPE